MLSCLVDVRVDVSQNGVEHSCGHGASKQFNKSNLLPIGWVLARLVKQKYGAFRIGLGRYQSCYMLKMYISEGKRWLNLAY